MNDYVLYILIRNDLPSMNVGRAAAQASHASNAFIHEFGKRKDVKTWQKSTTQGFGTAIILSASSPVIQSVLNSCDSISENIPIGWVVDPEYGVPVTKELFDFINKKVFSVEPLIKPDGTVVFFRSEKTCAYVFGRKSELTNVVGFLPLFPER